MVRCCATWLGDLGEDLAPLLHRRDRRELAAGHPDREIERAPVALVDDLAARAAVGQARLGRRAHEQARDPLDRPLRRREPDPHRPPLAQRFEPLEREREMRAALVARGGVDLVDDHRARAAQRLAAALGREHQVERLGRGDEDVRRALDQARAARRGRVARAHLGADLGQLRAALARDRGDLGQRRDQVLAHVGRERLQRRDVDDVGGVGAARPARPRAAAGRCRPGTRRASCPSRSAPRSACRGRSRSRASRAPAARSGPSGKRRSNQVRTAG